MSAANPSAQPDNESVQPITAEPTQGLPTRPAQAARRPATARRLSGALSYLLARRGFFTVGAVVALAWVAQARFTPLMGLFTMPQPGQSNGGEPLQGFYLYIGAISLMIVGFLFTYRRKDILRRGKYEAATAAQPSRKRVRVSAVAGGAAPPPRRRSWLRRYPIWRFVLGILAVAASGVAMWQTSGNRASLVAAVAWFASIILLVLACSCQKRGIWPLMQDNPPDYGDSDVDEDGRRDTGWFMRNRRVEAMLVAIIMAVAGLARLFNLEHIPWGMHGDEGETALRGLQAMQGNFSSVPFLGVSDWSYYPSMPYYHQIVGMTLFGTDSIAGIRFVSALSGVLTVLFFYLFMRLLFKGRTALIGAALIASGELAIQFARFPIGNEQVNTCWIACAYFLFKGLKTKRYLDFVWGGMAGAYSLYFYGASRQIVPFLALFLLYLAVTRWRFIRDYWSHSALAVTGFGVVASPMALITLQNTNALNERLQVVYLLWSGAAQGIFQRWGVPYTHPLPMDPKGAVFTLDAVKSVFENWNNGWKEVLWNQSRVAFGSINYETDHSYFYTPGLPMFGPVVAMFVILGVGYALWRWRDPRYFFLSMIFWGGIFIGVAMTVDAPNYLRADGVIPFLYAFPAIILNKFIYEIERTGWFAWPAFWRKLRVGRLGARPLAAGYRVNLIPGLLISLLLLTWMYQQLNTYFVTYNERTTPFAINKVPADYIRELGPSYYVYHTGMSGWFFAHSDVRYLAPEVKGVDQFNASDVIPFHNAPDKNVAFMHFGEYKDLTAPILGLYPQAVVEDRTWPDGGYFFTGVRISREYISATQTLKATYYTGDNLQQFGGVQAVTQTARLNSSGKPAGLRYPASVVWSGSVYAPNYGKYSFKLNSRGDNAQGAPMALYLDGQPWAELSGGQMMTNTEAVLALGWHHLELRAALPTSSTQTGLTWNGPGVSGPIASYYLFSGPNTDRAHGLYAEVKNASSLGAPVVQRRLDPYIGMLSVNRAIGINPPFSIRWSGKVLIPSDGNYTFLLEAQEQASLTVDGNAPNGGPLNLMAGEHDLVINYNGNGGDLQRFKLKWLRPDGQTEIIPNSILVPARAVFRASEVTDLNNAVVQPTAASILIPDRAISSSDSAPFTQPAAIAVDIGKNVYVADRETNTISKFAPDGSRAANWPIFVGVTNVEGKSVRIADMVINQDRLYVAANEGIIEVYRFDGLLIRTLNAGNKYGTYGLSGLCAGGNQLYATDAGMNRLFSVNEAEDRMERLIVSDKSKPQAQQLDQPVDCALTADGTLIIADLSKRIMQIGADGSVLQAWQLSGFEMNEGSQRMAVDGSRLYITSSGNNKLFLLDISDGSVSAFGEGGRSPGQFDWLYNVATDSDGNIYTLERNATRVQVFPPQ